MEEEVKYTSEFDGQTTDEVLKHAKSVKDLTIPSLSNISGFVCIDNEGKAIGMMSKEQVAQVVGGLIGRATGEKDGLFSRINAERRFSIVNKTLKIIAEKFSPCELFVYRYNTGVTTTGILHINSYLKSANWYLEEIEAYIDNESNVYIKGVPEESSNFHIIISPTISTINVAYEIIDGIIDTSSFQRINKK